MLTRLVGEKISFEKNKNFHISSNTCPKSFSPNGDGLPESCVVAWGKYYIVVVYYCFNFLKF